MARLSPHRFRHGWTRAGVQLGLALMLLLWITGALLELWPADAVFQLEAWKGAMRHASVTIHGTLAWFACLAAGRWAWPHVAHVWRLRPGGRWWFGVCTIAVTTCIALTGLALLYGPADWHEALGQVHWWIALAWPLLVLVHALPWPRRRAA